MYKLLELYCGIGGMRYALEAAGIPFEVVAAIDINPVSNQIYQQNFGSNGHYQKNLLSFTASDFEKMNADILTMSPPCQPFTRVGLKKDINDTRSDSFVHILKVISQLQRKPKYILVENVQGFENSIAQGLLLEMLRECKYRYQEFLLSPQDFGIPNSRLRYYLMACLAPTSLPFQESAKIRHDIPNMKDHMKCSNCVNNKDSIPTTDCPIKHFLENNKTQYFESFLVPDAVLLKYWSILDIVNENGFKSCCFTKAYYRYAQGTGSVLLPTQNIEEERALFQLVSKSEDKEEQLNLLKLLRLRYFTPKEIANLLCFPNKFEFPPNIERKQKYKSLGNSLNVFVVASLLNLLIQDQSENA